MVHALIEAYGLMKFMRYENNLVLHIDEKVYFSGVGINERAHEIFVVHAYSLSISYLVELETCWTEPTLMSIICHAQIQRAGHGVQTPHPPFPPKKKEKKNTKI